ncbi:MAG TPA: PEP-CTERM sorting domain-containing protein [Cyanobacteria bacterium UBA12227]|nr:PEP-CTERM sorting domain-containing protein [Cyanobacteria bacterium UBA12227]HBY76912.1 PEP-CTERM sorting domain-containing protein [Cyanobacteria bacterium UBA11148]
MKTNTFSRLGQFAAPLSIAATMVLGFSTQAHAISLGAASDYNVFTLGDMTQWNTDAEGKVAVGGNATLTNFYAGMGLPNSGNNGDVLIVSQDLLFTGGSVQGNAVYGGNATVSNVNFNNNGILRNDNPLDFAQVGKELQDLSKYLGGLTANGNKTIAYGGISLTGLDSSLNIFNVAASDLNGANSFKINTPTDSTVVVNISGPSAVLQNFGFEINGSPNNPQRQKVIYNFYEATNLTAQGIGIQGSVLAPFANFQFNNGQVNGNVIVGSLTGSGQSNLHLFNGNLPELRLVPPTVKVSQAVPEPATLAGLGLVAAAGIVSRAKNKKKG